MELPNTPSAATTSNAQNELTSASFFRVLHRMMPVAFCAVRIVRDEQGKPVDLEWLYQNEAASKLNLLPPEEGCRGNRLLQAFPGMREGPVWDACRRVAEDGTHWHGNLRYDGEHLNGSFKVSISRPTTETLALFFEDVTEAERESQRRTEEASSKETLLRVANILLDLDLESVVQKVTDAAREVCRAEFGAFFYNVTDRRGESYMLYAISGVHRKSFESFPMPRNTQIFAPTFSGECSVRSDDITQDPRYGKNSPFFGMPKGHLPVHSYLAVPVISRSGEVLGGMFLGHSQRAQFTERDERTLEALGHQAAAAMDNARLFEIAGRERERAEEANRAKDEFLATISHELRTPLQAMLGWARMLRMGTLTDEKRERAIEAIERNAKSQVALIEDVLDISRIITGKLRLEVQPVDMNQVVDAALDSVRPGAEAKQVRLQIVVDPDAGPVLGDANRLQQVIWNLLSNAVKFTSKGGRVLLHVYRESSHVKIVVSDNGQGIAPEFLPLAFERFRQADSKITRAHGGLGLGLSIVKHLTELHGGTAEVESPGLDQGATFTIKLPVAALRKQEAEGCPTSVRSGGDVAALDCPPNLAGLRILLVDDEPDARELLSTVLDHCHAEVTLAASAEQAFHNLVANPPDILISDIGMPGEDGYSLIRRVRALPADQGGRTLAIALTAYARSQDRTRVLAHGFNHHVAKPVEPAELLLVISTLAGRFQR